MRRLLCSISFLFVASACTPELSEEPRCRLTADGWSCDDGASPPDASSQSDMAQNRDDAAVSDDSGTTPPVDMGNDMGELPTPTSCAELKSRGDSGRGVRTLELGGSETEVFCDQDLDGGGWMLVARSVAGGTGDFGWNSATGSLDDDDSPFSIGRTDFPISELLIGNRGDAKAWGDRVYRVALPDNFIAACETTECGTTVTTVTGTCQATEMFDFAGRTQKTDSFWFRDVAGDSALGLFPDGWSTFYDDCVGGELNDQQGMLFAR